MTNLVTKKVIDDLRKEWGKVDRIDPSSDAYKRLIKVLNILNLAELKKLADANIKFVSSLALNRVNLKEFKGTPNNVVTTLKTLSGKPISLFESVKDKKIPGVTSFSRPMSGFGVIVNINKTAKVSDLGTILDKVEEQLGPLDKGNVYQRKLVGGLYLGSNFQIEITKG